MTLGRKGKKSHSPPCASLDTLTGRVHPGNIFFFGILLEQIATKNIRAHILPCIGASWPKDLISIAAVEVMLRSMG